MFRGTYTAIVTPFRDGAVDYDAFEKLIETQIEAGITGIVAVGTTGESATLSHEEHIAVIDFVVKKARGRCQVIAGTGSNSTSEAIALTRDAAAAGADAALLVAPYYNKPTQEGLYLHYCAIARATPLPLILYSIPGRSGVEIGVGTVARLAKDCPTIVAIKESGGQVARVTQLRAALPAKFDILSGDDGLTLAFMAAGAVGLVSVASNIVPKDCIALVNAITDGRLADGRAWHERLSPLFRDLFIETNPIPIKTALAWTGAISAEMRLPLCPMSEPNAAILRATLREAGILPR
jgi:4-hydroxy-tetrahydrodipicolinate synthase